MKRASSAPIKEEITALRPKIAARSPALGYIVDPTTGCCTINAVPKNIQSSKHLTEITSPYRPLANVIVSLISLAESDFLPFCFDLF